MSTIKPGITADARRISNALITRAKSPKVRIVIGKVRRSKMGLINVFSTPSTIATIIIVPIPIISTPGSKYPAIKTATQFTRRYKRSFMSKLRVSIILAFVNV